MALGDQRLYESFVMGIVDHNEPEKLRYYDE